MTTTTSTTSSTSTAVQTATKGLLDSLGSGSGVDSAALVTSLVEAQYAAQTARLTRRTETLTAQISGVSTIRSAITGFASALDALAKGGSLATQPRSSTAGVLTASAQPGATLAGLSTTITVGKLAAAQTVASAKVTVPGANDDRVAATRTTVLGSGRITLQLGTPTYATDAAGVTTMTALAPAAGKSVSFDLTDASVDSVAAAINGRATSLGVTASVVTGADGSAYLSLKGATGTNNAFSLTVAGDGSANLKQFEVGPGAANRITTKAQNAELTVDGVSVDRAGNEITDLVPGVKLELTTTGTTTLTAAKPTEGMTQAVSDVVDTYNQVLAIINEQTDAVNGTLAADPAAKSLLRSLKSLTLQTINPGAAPGEPRTLAELGVKTARDGTLSVDSAALSGVLARHPAAVETMFRSSDASATGLPAVLKALSASATSTSYGLGASNARYAKAQSDIALEQTKVASQSDTMKTRLTSQFAAMNSRVSAYKSVQSFLTNQIAAWNRSDD